MKNGAKRSWSEYPELDRAVDIYAEDEEHVRQLAEGLGVGKQLPGWVGMLGRVMCRMGLHSFRWTPTPYYLRCKRCEREVYAGP